MDWHGVGSKFQSWPGPADSVEAGNPGGGSVTHPLRTTWNCLLALVLAGAGVSLGAQSLGAPTALDFGEVVVDPSGGNMTLDTSGAITASAGIYTTSTLTRSASAILATGRNGRTASIFTTLTGNVTMSSTGGTFPLDPGPINSEYANNQFTFPSGGGTSSTSRTFHLAGTITIPAGQAAGDYNGVLPIYITVSGSGTGSGNSNTVNVPIHIRIIAPIALSKIQDLDMGVVIPGATAGSVTLNAATGAQGITGGVVYASPTGQAAQFAATGQPSHPFSIVLGSSPITLSGPGGTMSLALLASPSGSSTFSAAGTSALNVGGTLTVGANQADGDYTGTFTLTVSYP